MSDTCKKWMKIASEDGDRSAIEDMAEEIDRLSSEHGIMRGLFAEIMGYVIADDEVPESLVKRYEDLVSTGLADDT